MSVSAWPAEEVPFRLTLNTTKPLCAYLRPAPYSPPVSPRFFHYSHLLSVLVILPFASTFCVCLLRIILSHHLRDWSHITLLHFQLHDMVLLTPKFVFVAALASLTAFSLAPPADAAAITVRPNNQHHPSDSSGAWSGSSLNYVNHPTIPLPARLTSVSGKQTQDRNREPQRESFKVTYPSPMLSTSF